MPCRKPRHRYAHHFKESAPTNFFDTAMKHDDNQPIEPIAQSTVADTIESLPGSVEALSVVTTDLEQDAAANVESSTGAEPVAYRTGGDGRLREILFGHRPSGPVYENSISPTGGVTPNSLAFDMGHLIDEDYWFRQLAQKSGDAVALRHGASRLTLPREVLFRLTIAHEQRPQLYRHSLEVTIVAHYLALRLNLPPKSIDSILIAALCHDLGELYVDPSILGPDHRISGDERRFIDVHPIAGCLLVRDIPNLDPEVAKAIIQHQERLDGSGYPYAIDGKNIGIAGRILAASDTSASIMARFKDHRRLSTLLRLNSAKYDRKIVDLMLEAILPTSPTDIQPVDQASIACVTDFTQIINQWSHLRANSEIATVTSIAFLAERIHTLRTVLVAAGFDPDGLDSTLLLAAEDSSIARELAAVIDELKFQLVDLEREIDRRAPVWSETIDPITRVALDNWRGLLHEFTQAR